MTQSYGRSEIVSPWVPDRAKKDPIGVTLPYPRSWLEVEGILKFLKTSNTKLHDDIYIYHMVIQYFKYVD